MLADNYVLFIFSTKSLSLILKNVCEMCGDSSSNIIPGILRKFMRNVSKAKFYFDALEA